MANPDMRLATLVGALMRRILKACMRIEHEPPDFEIVPRRATNTGQLYVHIPFCPSLCPFCTFHRVAFRRELAEPYFAAVRAEIDRYEAVGYRFQDVYIGGGTPTMLPEALGELIAHVRSRFPLRYIAVETNPSHLTDDLLAILQTAGVNRLSVGVQSFDDALLKRLGRLKYGRGDEIQTALSRATGRLPTLNVDMMFNLPAQTEASLDRDLQIILRHPAVNQTTFYPLMTTAASRAMIQSRMGWPRSREHAYYERVRLALEGDMPRSSIWCFSCNPSAIGEYMAYHDDCVGVGSGAFSYLDGQVLANTFCIPRYVDRVHRGLPSITGMHTLSVRERMRLDFLVKLFGLRLNKARIEAKYGGRFRSTLWKELLAFRALGAVEETADEYRLSQRGLYTWVVMMREFLNGLNAVREEMRAHVRAEQRQDQTIAHGRLLAVGPVQFPSARREDS